MLEKTRKQYHSRANFNLQRWMRRYPDVSLTEYMHAIAKETGGDSWRVLRCALRTLLEDGLEDNSLIGVKGIDYKYALSEIRDVTYQHIDTSQSEKLTNKSTKQKRGDRNSMTDEEHARILNTMNKNKEGDRQLECLLEILKLTGMRPIEVFHAELNAKDDELVVIGAKKSANGKRGMDRRFHLFPEVSEKLASYYAVIDEVIESDTQQELFNGSQEDEAREHAISKLQKRLGQRLHRLTEKIWPERENQITFKSYRHQFSSDMKAGGLPPVEIAAFLGHQSVRSQSQYGRAKKGGRAPSMAVAQASMNAVRMRTPREMFAKKAPQLSS